MMVSCWKTLHSGNL